MFLATHGVLRRSSAFVPPVFADTYSFEYDGVNDHIIAGNVLNMADDGSDPFTISFWCKGVSGSGIHGYIGKMNSALEGYQIYRSSSNIFMLLGDYPSSAIMANYVFSNVNDGNWHHFAWTYDGSQDVSGFSLYIDSVEVSLGTIVNNTPSNVVTTSDLSIASRGGSKFNNAYFDEPAIFDYELTSTEVSSIYGLGVPTDISSLNPVGHWRAENGSWDGSKWTITDSGSGGNDAESVSMTLASRTSDVPT